MPEINPGSEAGNQDSLEYWCDELKNTKDLLFELNKAISALTTGGHESYSLSTGQSDQKVKRLDLGMLREWRNDLIYQIRELEMKCGKGTPAVKQVRPAW